jgi:hypothetical protein
MKLNSKREQSEFNMAVSYLNRLNDLFYSVDQASIRLDIVAWYHSLMALFRELSTEMKQDEITQYETEMISNTMPLLKTHILNLQKGLNEVDPKLYRKLHNFELFLRKVLKESGLQQKIMESAEKALR